jgi:hypothetical protein
MATWCSVTQAQAITGELPSDTDLAVASSIIEMVAGVFADAVEETAPEAGDAVAQYIADRDLRWLRMACAWQSVWVKAHPDLMERDLTSTESADGQSAAWLADGQILAPLAKRALRNLSWRGTRSIGISTGPEADALDYLDDRLQWTPLP